MKKKEILISSIGLFFLVVLTVSAGSLYDYYIQRQGSFPSISERAEEYESVFNEEYKGTVEQNIQFKNYLESGQSVLGGSFQLSSFVRKNLPDLMTTNASSTRTYMTPGKATTTLAIDSYAGGSGAALSNLALAVQLTASTGLPTLNIGCEYSQDGVDWYRGDCYNTASTTNIFNPTAPSSFTWLFASSTCALAGNSPSATESICERIFELRPWTRWMRAVFTFASTTAATAINNEAGAVWAEFIGKR